MLEVSTRETSRRGADAALRSWLLDEADYHLAPRLLHESKLVGRRPASVQVRLQRTRWGSCSNSGTISLNAALLFLEPPLVRYLLVHELCHLLALNHSRRFWAAVARCEPDYEALDRRLVQPALRERHPQPGQTATSAMVSRSSETPTAAIGRPKRAISSS